MQIDDLLTVEGVGSGGHKKGLKTDQKQTGGKLGETTKMPVIACYLRPDRHQPPTQRHQPHRHGEMKQEQQPKRQHSKQIVGFFVQMQRVGKAYAKGLMIKGKVEQKQKRIKRNNEMMQPQKLKHSKSIQKRTHSKPLCPNQNIVTYIFMNEAVRMILGWEVPHQDVGSRLRRKERNVVIVLNYDFDRGQQQTEGHFAILFATLFLAVRKSYKRAQVHTTCLKKGLD